MTTSIAISTPPDVLFDLKPNRVRLRRSNVNVKELRDAILSGFSDLEKDSLFAYYRDARLIRRLTFYAETDAARMDRRLESIHARLSHTLECWNHLEPLLRELGRSGVSVVQVNLDESSIDEWQSILRLWGVLHNARLEMQVIYENTWAVYHPNRLHLEATRAFVENDDPIRHS